MIFKYSLCSTLQKHSCHFEHSRGLWWIMIYRRKSATKPKIKNKKIKHACFFNLIYACLCVRLFTCLCGLRGHGLCPRKWKCLKIILIALFCHSNWVQESDTCHHIIYFPNESSYFCSLDASYVLVCISEWIVYIRQIFLFQTDFKITAAVWKLLESKTIIAQASF